jgi:hypothetical protein
MARRAALDDGGACYSERTDWTFRTRARRPPVTVREEPAARPNCLMR